MGIVATHGTLCDRQTTDRQQEKLRIQSKGPHKRHLTLGPHSQRALITYLDQHRLKEPGRNGEDAIFLTEAGRRLTPNTITQLFLRLNERAALTEQPVSPSMLRETFAVRYLQTGGDPFSLQKLLGRADLAMIKRYQQRSEQMREKPTTNKNAGELRDHELRRNKHAVSLFSDATLLDQDHPSGNGLC